MERFWENKEFKSIIQIRARNMIYLPSSRRHLLSAVAVLILILLWRSSLGVPKHFPSFVLHQPPLPTPGIRIPISSLKSNSLLPINTSENHLSPPAHYLYNWIKAAHPRTFNGSVREAPWSRPALNPHIEVLWKCPRRENKYTNHIRLANIVQNISDIPPNPMKPETRIFWNPTIIALPYWAENQYLVVSRVVTDGNYQENVICEANFCYTGSPSDARKGEKPCTQEDLVYTGPAGGLRCVTVPVILNVPPTPAEKCEGKFGTYVDIPGFHDPRIFWSGRGEPLMMVNTQSRYACFGLWVIDLRTLYEPLVRIVSSSPRHDSPGPLMSYPTLTELTRNPSSTRSPIEKNWMFFYPSTGESFLHYDISSPNNASQGRTFAKVIGSGLTTTNLTDPFELPCIPSLPANETDPARQNGKWHQATNSLRLILCNRSDRACKPSPDNTVFFAIVHRKHPNYLKLPLRYERYFIVWAATPPFSMLGISQHPLLVANETASGWGMAENWDDDPVNAKTVADHKKQFTIDPIGAYGGKGYWAYFTYTVSIAWAAGRDRVEVADMNEGYLDDEVILGIGIDDAGQGVARVRAGELVACLRPCPGRGS